MQFSLHPSLQDNQQAKRGKDIIATCVHCGFCSATCPTYQLLGDERDSPRGRIYLIKQLLQTNKAGATTQTHLDRCLTCRSCETTCPSGVKYGELLEIGRNLCNEKVPRKLSTKLMHFGLRQVLPSKQRFSVLLKTAQIFKHITPATLSDKFPDQVNTKQISIDRSSRDNTAINNTRRMILLSGCAQPSATPNTNIITQRVFQQLGISLVEAKRAGCCGAVNTHLDAKAQGKAEMRRNIDAWWPEIAAGAEAIVITASACGLMVKEYQHYLADDADYADKAKKVSALARDASEILINEDLSKLTINDDKTTVFHGPCTLQHGLPDGKSLVPVVEELLRKVGVNLVVSKDSHLCCGSAGTYSILQPRISQQLLQRKLTALQHDNPTQIVTANVGCQLHLASKSIIPVKHWIELFNTDSRIS